MVPGSHSVESSPAQASVPAAGATGFSLVAGGPFHALLRRLGLIGPDLEGEVRRAIACMALTWLPLFVLAAIDGHAWGGSPLPLLADADVAARFLVAMPLLIAAEVILNERFPSALARFQQRELVSPREQARFDAIVASARRWSASWGLELGLLVIVAAWNLAGMSGAISGMEGETWYAGVEGGQRAPRPAGWWLLLVSVPLLQFVLLRWYLRLFVWWRLLWQLSRLDLQLQPLHPDKAGGLGFLANLCEAFAVLVMAQGAMASGWIANRIFHEGAQLLQYKLDLAAMAAIVVFAVAGPTLFFVPVLARARRAGLGRMGNLAMQYAAEFEGKWLRSASAPPESPLGSGDVQSLADLGNAYAQLKDMRRSPIGVQVWTNLGIALLVPVAPLLLTMVSVEELLRRVVQFLL